MTTQQVALILMVAGLADFGVAALAQRTIRRYQEVLPSLAANALLLRRLVRGVIFFGIAAIAWALVVLVVPAFN